VTKTSTPAAISRRETLGGRLAIEEGAASLVELDRAHLLLHGVHTETCPQCGINPATGPKARTFRWSPPWLFALWLWVALLSMAISPLLSLGVIGAAFFARRKVTTTFSLCDDCDSADIRARRIRAATVTAGFLTPPIAAAALGLMNQWGWPASLTVRMSFLGVATVAGIAGAVFGHVKTSKAALFVRRITGKIVRLKASPSWQRVLAEEQPAALFRKALPEPDADD